MRVSTPHRILRTLDLTIGICSQKLLFATAKSETFQ
jgi:hypothetical protein